MLLFNPIQEVGDSPDDEYSDGTDSEQSAIASMEVCELNLKQNG